MHVTAHSFKENLLQAKLSTSRKTTHSIIAYDFFNFVFSKCAYCTLFGDMLSNEHAI